MLTWKLRSMSAPEIGGADRDAGRVFDARTQPEGVGASPVADHGSRGREVGQQGRSGGAARAPVSDEPVPVSDDTL